MASHEAQLVECLSSIHKARFSLRYYTNTVLTHAYLPSTWGMGVQVLKISKLLWLHRESVAWTTEDPVTTTTTTSTLCTQTKDKS